MMTHLQKMQPTQCASRRQGGVALLLLLLLLLVGAGVVFVSQLKSASLELETQRKTAAALAEAKAALLGRAASNNDPGTLPCPSTDGTNGTSTTYAVGAGKVACGESSLKKSNFGWLPWRTLGVGQLRDGSASLLWYMLSEGFVDKGTYSPPPNALTLTVTIVTVTVNRADLSETVVATNTVTDVAAVIVAAGSPFPNQVRSGTAQTDSSYSAAYFEGTADSAFNTMTIKVEKRDGLPPAKYNDQYLLVTTREVFDRSTPLVASSFAVQLSDYYAANGNVYPPTGWLPVTGDWASGQMYGPWVTYVPAEGRFPTAFTKTGTASGQVQFVGCAAVFSIQQVAGGPQVTRSGHC